MTKREIIKCVFDHQPPPYVPWSFSFTKEARDKLLDHYGGDEALEAALDDHLLRLGSDIGARFVGQHGVR